MGRLSLKEKIGLLLIILAIFMPLLTWLLESPYFILFGLAGTAIGSNLFLSPDNEPASKIPEETKPLLIKEIEEKDTYPYPHDPHADLKEEIGIEIRPLPAYPPARELLMHVDPPIPVTPRLPKKQNTELSLMAPRELRTIVRVDVKEQKQHAHPTNTHRVAHLTAKNSAAADAKIPEKAESHAFFENTPASAYSELYNFFFKPAPRETQGVSITIPAESESPNEFRSPLNDEDEYGALPSPRENRAASSVPSTPLFSRSGGYQS